MADTVTILSTSVFSNSATLISNKVKGDAYFGATDGLHTLLVDLDAFIGVLKIQGSLESTPSDNDWFDINLVDAEFTVDVSGLVTKKIKDNLTYTVAETSKISYNVSGNFVWLRANISSWTGGTVNRIEMNR
mgnify:CR=1 FL=1|tara:strand:- start:7688 stop:8083 length:396 start_codon:yes stop_codon:yes gene_type:complete